LTGSRSKLVYAPLPADDPSQRQPDIALARQRLGWNPAIPLSEGLVKTIEWFRSMDLAHYRPPTPNY
jgi:UDP-glucuronate decarboxylase